MLYLEVVEAEVNDVLDGKLDLTGEIGPPPSTPCRPGKLEMIYSLQPFVKFESGLVLVMG